MTLRRPRSRPGAGGRGRESTRDPAPAVGREPSTRPDADWGPRACAIAQFRFRQKLELVRRGLQDESPAARGSALIALEALSRDHPCDVNGMRAMLHELASNDPNMAVRRLAIVCLKNGSAQRETILILNGLADDDEQEADLRKTAKAVAAALTKKSRS